MRMSILTRKPIFAALILVSLGACRGAAPQGSALPDDATPDEAADTASVPDAAAPVINRPDAGSLTVLDWSGYENPDYFADFTAAHPEVQLQHAVMEQDVDGLTKMKSGLEADLVHPCSNYYRMWVDAGLVQPVDTARLSNWKGINAKMADLGRFDGKQYFVPWDWGFDSILVRTDKVDPVPGSWADLWNPAYKGKLSMSDMPDYNHAAAALALGIADPWSTTPEQNAQIKAKMAALQPNILAFWGDGTELAQQISSGDVWVGGNAWPDAYTLLVQEGLPVAYAKPKEGRLSWVCGYGISAKAKDVDLAYAYIDAMIAPKAMAAFIDEFGFGAANFDALPLADAETVARLELDDPKVIDDSIFYAPLTEAQRDAMVAAWDEVKADQ